MRLKGKNSPIPDSESTFVVRLDKDIIRLVKAKALTLNIKRDQLVEKVLRDYLAQKGPAK